MIPDGTKRVYLIGNRGVGKSTVGSELADCLRWGYFDSDSIIESYLNRSIANIFKKLGEPAFRALESRLIQAFGEAENLVVAWGGGIVLDPANRESLKKGWCIWLQASPETIWHRIEADPATEYQRPALTDLDGFTEIQKLVSDREPLYREVANLIVNTDNRSPDEVVSDILSAC